MKIRAEYNSVWDGGFLITTPCTVDSETGEVVSELADGVDDDGCEVEHLDREYVEFLGREFDVDSDGHIYDYVLVDLNGFKEVVK